MIRVGRGENDIEVSQHIERATQALVPSFAPGTLPTDPKHVEIMFVSSTNNWRTYAGEKPGGDKLARINAVYKQATHGDCTDTEWSTPFEKTVLRIWRSYKGTPTLMAKRRYLTLLRDVDPRLLQMKAFHFMPWGFPRTAKGERICPYSNTKKGCPRPLTDKYGRVLEHELDHNESLAEFTNLRKWLDEVGTQQRCAMGLHIPIPEEAGRKFSTFFARPECGGFQHYAQAKLDSMVGKVLRKQLVAFEEMQNNPRNFSKVAQAHQRDRIVGLQQYYTALTGCEFSNEVPCSRVSHHCETRRLAEGTNHTHPVVIRMPPTDLSVFDALIQVRRECVRLGVTPNTGPVHSIDHRCRLLQLKVVEFHRKQMLVYESRRRQQWRADILPHDNAMFKSFVYHHRSDCLRRALEAKDMDRVCVVVESGADPTTELRSGLFPLLAGVLKRCVPDIRRLVAGGADLDACNSKGMSALMWAVKRDDYAMVDALLEEGADAGVEGCSGWTAMSVAARHGRRDIAQLIVEHIRKDKIVGEMNADRVLNHRSVANGGLTPVAIAAIHRDELMARSLMRLGARPGVKCHQGYVAGEHAAKAGWTVFGLWLQETQAFGKNGVYTFADMSAESALRTASVRMLDAISTGATVKDGAKRDGGSRSAAPSGEAFMKSGGSTTEYPVENSNHGPAQPSTPTIRKSDSSAAAPAISIAVTAQAPAAESAEKEEVGQERETAAAAIAAKLLPSATPSGSNRAETQAEHADHPTGFLEAMNIQLEQVRSNTLLTVSILQEGRAAPDTETDGGHTALISAAYRGRSNAVRSLIQEGADPNYANRNGRTALMAAAAAGDRPVALILLRHGADATRVDIHGKVAGAYAFERGLTDLGELLAIAVYDGNEAAIAWEIDRSRREEEEKERQQMQDLLDRVGGGSRGMGGEDVSQEAHLQGWIIRVTRPREAARRAGKTNPKLRDEHSNSPPRGGRQQQVQQQGRRSRCPKCTLMVPCRHFSGTELPDGVDEWVEWGKRSVSRGRGDLNNPRGGRRRRGSVGAPSETKGVAWLRDLHQLHRDRTLPPAGKG